MTDIMTRDNHDIAFSVTTDNSTDDLESIADVNVLQEMLEQSEDLEFRRLVRARLRKLKKGKQENEPASKPPNKATTERKFIPQTTVNGGGVDLKSAGSNLRKTSNTSVSSYSQKIPLADTNQCGDRLSEVKLRSTSVSKGTEDKTQGFKMEEVVLKSTPRNSPCPSNGDKKGKPTYDVALKHVPTTSSSGSGSGSGCGSGSRSAVASAGLLRNRGNPTPRQALKHFKEMDSEALLRNPGDPNDGLKRMSRNLSPNTIKDQTLNWCKNRLYSYENIRIEDFSGSWNNGLAFCALANSFFPQAFDYDSLTPEDRGRNFQLAFDTLEREAGVVPLLEVEDMVSTRNPDWKCVFTYVNSVIARMAEIRKEKEEEVRKSLLLSSDG